MKALPLQGWLFPSLRGYDRKSVHSDLIAGLTVWAVLIPEALAYATIAGVSPVVGLYAAPGALLFYAAFGSSRHLVVGPMSATAALSAATVATYATPGTSMFVTMTAALAISAGMAALIAGLLRLGFLANFISAPVLKGFIIGLALTIIIGQVPDLLGISKGSGDFFQKLWHVITHLGDSDGLTLLVGAGSLAVLIGLRRLWPGVPASLVVVALSEVAVVAFNLNDHGVAIVGHINGGLPSFGVPDISFHDFIKLAAGGIGVMLVGFAEGLGAAETYATRNHYDVDANRELIGLGAANLAAGLSSGMVVNGSLSKTAVNGTAGGRSQISGLAVAALTIVTLLFLTSLFEKLPYTTLAAVVIVAVIDLVDYRALVRLYRIYTHQLGQRYGVTARADFIAAVAALLGVTVFDTLPGLFIGIAVSFLLLVFRASRPRVAQLGKEAGAPHYSEIDQLTNPIPTPGIVVLRVESELFFANADWVRLRVLAEAARPEIRAVVLDASNINSIDVTAVSMLDQLADELRGDGVQFKVARAMGGVREVVRKAGDDADLKVVYPTVEEAIEALAPAPDATPAPGPPADRDSG